MKLNILQVTLFFVLFLFYGKEYYSQEGTIVFEKVFHDFGLIEEERGVVISEFQFTNTSKNKFKITETKTSCGCTTIGTPQEVITKGDTLTVLVAYNPIGLPGRFNKTVQLTFEDNKGRKLERFLKLKGVTVSMTAKNVLKPIDSLQKERNVIAYYRQKDFDDKVNTQEEEYQKMIATATKVALMHQRVNILITIYHPEPDFSFEKILFDAYDNVRLDLMEKGLPDNRIVFLDPVVELSSRYKYVQISVINKGSYTLRNPDDVVEFNQGDTLVSKDNVEFYIQIGAFKKKKKTSEFDSFGTTKEYRNEGIYRYRVGTYPNLAKAKEYLKLIKEKGYKDAFILAKNNDSRITIAEADSIVRNQVVHLQPKVFRFYQMALPLYMQYFTGGLRDVDTTLETYKTFLDNFVLYAKGNEEKIKLLVVSSASKWKHKTDNFDNEYIARLRGENSLNTLKQDLQSRGVNVDALTIEIEDKVIGPPMNKRNYNHLYYKSFQYLKFIPMYINDEAKSTAKGYIHYYKKSTEAINPRDYEFYSFVDRLETIIKQKGVVKLSLEGSSSKTCVSTFSSNEKLAYTRIEDLKENLERALYKRGINPQRMEILEEVALVQGPEPGKAPKEEYLKYQYVKAVVLNR